MPIRSITTKLKKISVNDLEKETFKKSLLIKFLEIKSKDIFSRIENYIIGTKLLDIGTGIGGIAAFLSIKGFTVESVDVDNSSYFIEFPTTIYNGTNLPYQDNSFDTALLINVLHHCGDSRLQVLREAIRTSKRVIFIEDTYRNRLEWLIVSIDDMIGNGEYYFHKYSTPEEWREIIKKENCKIVVEKSFSSFIYHILYGRYVLFVIEKE